MARTPFLRHDHRRRPPPRKAAAMTASPAAVPGQSRGRYDIDALLADVGDVPVVTDAVTVRRKSRDFFWYSPILNASLHGKSADIIAAPRDEADVIRVAAACARRRIPLTV